MVTWTTFSNSNTETEVEFGVTLDAMNRKIQGSQELFEDGGVLKRTEYIHRVIFPSDLPANTRFCKFKTGFATMKKITNSL